MSTMASRPAAITIVAILVAINGIVSILDAFTLAAFTVEGVVGAVISVIIGLLLLHRAYGLWTIQPGAWLITLILMCLRTITGLLETIASLYPLPWIRLAFIVVTILYLIQPEIRNIFLQDKARR